jgi:hypothetical protein
MKCDWEHKTLEFADQGVSVKLCGDGSSMDTELLEISVIQVHKWLQGNDILAFVLLEERPMPTEPNEQCTGDLQALLLEFQDVFAPPTSLPPSRPYDHHIPLLPGVVPVNAKPY